MYAAAYIGHLGDYRCPACGHARPQLHVRAREIELNGLESVSFELVAPEGSRRVELGVPGLYNVYNALAAGALARALGASLDAIRAGLQGFSAAFGRFERIAIGERSLLVLLIKNPAGANEVVRTLVDGGAAAAAARRAQRRDRRRPGRLVDLGRRLRAAARRPRAADRERTSAPRSWRCASSTPAFPRTRSRSCPRSRRRSTAGLELTPPGEELLALPTYTAMLGLRELVARRGFVRPYWEGRVKIVVGHLFPDYLNIYADRGNIAVLERRAAWRGHELEVRASRRRQTSSRRASTTSTTSAAARTGSRS